MSEKNFNHKQEALSFFTMAHNFLTLVRLAVLEILEYDNNTNVLKDTNGESNNWEAMTVSTPILFNFYHGLELAIKGYLVLQANNKTSVRGHWFTHLIKEYKMAYPKEHDTFISLVQENTINLPEQSIMGKFLSKNKIGIDSWYSALKYPYEKKHEFCRMHFKYSSNQKEFWQDILEATTQIMHEVCRFYQDNVASLEDDEIEGVLQDNLHKFFIVGCNNIQRNSDFDK